MTKKFLEPPNFSSSLAARQLTKKKISKLHLREGPDRIEKRRKCPASTRVQTHDFSVLGSGCSTGVEHTPRDREVMGSNPAGCWAFFSTLSFSEYLSIHQWRDLNPVPQAKQF